jgi:hypothetical protein
VRSFRVELLLPLIHDMLLLLQPTGYLAFQLTLHVEVHALMTAVLIRTAQIDTIQDDTQGMPSVRRTDPWPSRLVTHPSHAVISYTVFASSDKVRDRLMKLSTR